MKRRSRYLWGAVLVVVVLAAVGLFLLYLGTQYVPPAYREAMTLDPAVAAKRSDEMLRQATALSNRIRKEGRWEAVFTAEQINGWLAVDLPKNHADALPETLSDPRVAIAENGVVLFCRYENGQTQSVLSLMVDAYVPSPEVLAVRILGGRAGRVPVPIGDVLENISKAALEAEVPLQWKQTDGDPVAVITLPEVRQSAALQVRIDALELRSGAVYVAGTTQRVGRPGGRAIQLPPALGEK